MANIWKLCNTDCSDCFLLLLKNILNFTKGYIYGLNILITNLYFYNIPSEWAWVRNAKANIGTDFLYSHATSTCTPKIEIKPVN